MQNYHKHYFKDYELQSKIQASSCFPLTIHSKLMLTENFSAKTQCKFCSYFSLLTPNTQNSEIYNIRNMVTL